MGENPNILFVKPGALKPSEKGRCRKAGVLVIEVDDPANARLVRAESWGADELSHGELLSAAAQAFLDCGDYASQVFGKRVARALVARHGSKETDSGE